MSLSTGSRVGSYTILGQIGAGGMGEVYRARDSRLDRDVAIKILPVAFAQDPERLGRFEREAKTLAALNHPHIAHIYGFEQSGDTSALVMELVDGEDLAQRIARGPLTAGDALPIAQQIAEALEAAHEQGIVHRDLKPSNVKVRPDGTVKVLDFGLAKALAREDSAADISHSPTITVNGTRAGVVLGTAAYMSPEQARGRAIDKRTDVWAFGCVLYEMLTGRAAFARDTVSDTIAAILEHEPEWSRLPPATPPRVHRVLRRCLQKDSRRRLRDIGDARLELEDETNAPAAPAVSGQSWTTLLAVIAAVIVTAVVTAAFVVWLRGTPAATTPMTFTFSPPANEAFAPVSAAVPSPDGRRIAFVTRQRSGAGAIWIRAIDATSPQRVAGTEGAAGTPFWSPDGRYLGFVAAGRLKRVDPAGGPALTICSVQGYLGAAWGRDNIIVLAPANRTSLHRVSAAGGTPEPITVLNSERRENSHRHPSFLPDGRRFLFTARSDVKENNVIYLASLDSTEIKPLIAAQSNAVYAPPGYLLFASDGSLMAQRFDAAAGAVAGDAFPVGTRVNHITPSSHALFAVSADGNVLTYQAGVTPGLRPTWLDRTGKIGLPVGLESGFSDVRIAPNGKLATLVRADPDSGNRDIWLINFATENLTRLTSNPANDWQVAWAPDSKQIAFATDRHGRSSVYRKSIDGGEETLLLQMPDRGVFPKDWSADGRVLAMNVDSPSGRPQIWALPLGGEQKPFALRESGFRENEPTISPDGRWVAYESNESGATEVYIKPLMVAGKTRLSTGGGTMPRWRADGRELYYRVPNGDLMAITVAAGDMLETSPPVRLFTPCDDAAPAILPQGAGTPYDVAPDGRFIFLCASPDSAPASITVSINWTAALKP